MKACIEVIEEGVEEITIGESMIRLAPTKENKDRRGIIHVFEDEEAMNKWYEEKKIKPARYVIEHYPKTKIYAVKYKSGWLFDAYNGIISVASNLFAAGHFESKTEAKNIIELHEEQEYKLGVKRTYID